MPRLPDLALVHLVRHANGFDPFEAFMASYEAHPAGREHDLVLLFKGFPAPAEAAAYLERAGDSRPTALYVDDSGLDLTAYLTAAERLRHPLVGFANSFSEILADDWLELLSAPVANGAGAAGATGSWGGGLSYKLFQAGVPGGYADIFDDRRAVRARHARDRRDAYRGDLLHWIGNLVYMVRDFRTLSLFPAVHLRTNAFVIERERLLSLRAGRLDSKARRVPAGERAREHDRAADRPRAAARRRRSERRGASRVRVAARATCSGRAGRRTCSSPTTRRAGTRTARLATARCSAASPGASRPGPERK